MYAKTLAEGMGARGGPHPGSRALLAGRDAFKEIGKPEPPTVSPSLPFSFPGQAPLICPRASGFKYRIGSWLHRFWLLPKLLRCCSRIISRVVHSQPVMSAGRSQASAQVAACGSRLASSNRFTHSLRRLWEHIAQTKHPRSEFSRRGRQFGSARWWLEVAWIEGWGVAWFGGFNFACVLVSRDFGSVASECSSTRW